MCCSKLMSRAVRSAKRDWNIKLTARHHEHVRRVVHDLIERDQRKAPGHKLNDRSQPGHRCANSKAGKSVLANRRIDDSSRREPLEQTLTLLVSAMIFGSFRAHEENVRVALQLFRERFVQRLTVSDFPHDFPPSKKAYL